MKNVFRLILPPGFPLYFILVLGSVILYTAEAQAQGLEEHQAHHHRAKDGHFRASLVIGHTLIPSLVDGSKENIMVPSWGMDLEYWMNHKWGIGLHNDIEVETFEVLSTEQEYVERVYPIVFTLDVLWRPWKGLVLLAGPGVEFERNEDLELVRLGAEYEIEIFDSWDLSPNFFYDARFEAFDTWSIGLGVGKRF